jgi:hypothetical protein
MNRWLLPALIVLVPATVVVVSSCENNDIIDQCLRREIYKECMDAAPKDKEPWSKIMDKCSRLSEYQSLRQLAQVKPECRP